MTSWAVLISALVGCAGAALRYAIQLIVVTQARPRVAEWAAGT
jgi:hypothetical protein